MILVIGSGVAGIRAALAAAGSGAEVTLVTPGVLLGGGAETGGAADRGVSDPAAQCGSEGLRALAGGSTALAQGGIAAALADDDTPGLHLADTLAAGAGIVDSEAAGLLVREGARAVRELLAEGFEADRAPGGSVALGLEAAHVRKRIVHAGGDRTGAVLHAHLVSRLRAAVAAGRIVLRERCTAIALIREAGAVAGAELRGPAGIEACRAGATVLASGGYAGLYARSSNPLGSRGAGVLLAGRAGALLADLEFVQFHPTVLHGTGTLISEAVRGAGAVLLDGSGTRYLVPRHPLAELAPRDVVSRETTRLLAERGEDHVLLDATGIEREGGPGTLAARFPGITAATRARGLDWRREPIPVSPAAHYCMGGVASDLDGRTSVPGLFVAGEVASTGVHGANRLASNSLLEGLVFGERAGIAAAAVAGVASGGGAPAAARDGRGSAGAWRPRGAGFLSLERRSRVAAIPDPPLPDAEPGGPLADRSAGIPALTGLLPRNGEEALLIGMIRDAALDRTESRGAHQRPDHPHADPAQAARRAVRFLLPASAEQPAPPASERRSLSPC
ncbi:L-aspartate oxidase [Leucobacter massiliensis]|uniref:L-aspartate oxidase n=1 Tax=Leucobacter massiliensis TaxID=1686285 RepID=A0A2S9QL39_9MICO|nr:FAD-binding protein [Leucobacter massiliensis]PRI10305.1 L-aspartate oxidase [Leucobacter massiliensis]